MANRFRMQSSPLISLVDAIKLRLNFFDKLCHIFVEMLTHLRPYEPKIFSTKSQNGRSC